MNHVPTGLRPLIAQLVVSDGRALIRFLEQAFGATLQDALPGPDGKGIMHAHVTLEGETLFLAEPFGPAPLTRSNVFVYVRDAAATVKQAEKAGAKVVMPVNDMPWGDRWGMIEDPFGNHWQIATHVEDVPADEMKRRMAQQQR
jgi:PhnB protein